MTAPVRVTRRRDLEVLQIGNDRLRLSFLPQYGGRMISLAVDGHELLWRNPNWLDRDLTPTSPCATWPVPDDRMGSWVNLGGSKTWPAPQGWSGPGEWAGPPDPVLDAGAYTWREGEDATLTMISAPDPRTGVCVTRVLDLPGSGTAFTLMVGLTNVSDRDRTWSAWEVTQVTTELGGRVEVAVGSDERIADLLVAEGRPDHGVADGLVTVPVQKTVAKLGFPGATGTIRWVRADGATLTQEVDVLPETAYPDGGCPVELWLQHPLEAPLSDLGGLHPDAHLVELETLSPLTRLAPGETVRLPIRWTCTPPL